MSNWLPIVVRLPPDWFMTPILPTPVPTMKFEPVVPTVKVPSVTFKVPVLPLTLPTVKPPVACVVLLPERIKVPLLTVVTPV